MNEIESARIDRLEQQVKVLTMDYVGHRHMDKEGEWTGIPFPPESLPTSPQPTAQTPTFFGAIPVDAKKYLAKFDVVEPMTVSDEAVEAAARELSVGEWDALPEELMSQYRRAATAALTAALPFLTADPAPQPAAEDKPAEIVEGREKDFYPDHRAFSYDYTPPQPAVDDDRYTLSPSPWKQVEKGGWGFVNTAAEIERRPFARSEIQPAADDAEKWEAVQDEIDEHGNYACQSAKAAVAKAVELGLVPRVDPHDPDQMRVVVEVMSWRDEHESREDYAKRILTALASHLEGSK